MKQCPTCQTIYDDDLLEICVTDGANLISEIPQPKEQGSGYNLIIGLIGGFIVSIILATIMFIVIFKFIVG